MTSARIVRWSLLAATLAGALLVASNLVLVGADYDSFAATLVASRFTVHLVLFWIAATLALFGLVGLYARQSERAGALGLAGFVLAFAGTALELATTWSETFALGALATVSPLLVSDPSGRVAAGLYVAFPVFVSGWLLFAVATLRAGVLPQAPATALVLGIVLLLPGAVVPGLGAAFGAAVAWLGYASYRSA
jgi:hypothetical protein